MSQRETYIFIRQRPRFNFSKLLKLLKNNNRLLYACFCLDFLNFFSKNLQNEDQLFASLYPEELDFFNHGKKYWEKSNQSDLEIMFFVARDIYYLNESLEIRLCI